MADTHEEQLLSALLREIGEADRAAPTPAIGALEARVLDGCDAAASARSQIWKRVVVAGVAAALLMVLSGAWLSRAVPSPVAAIHSAPAVIAAAPPQSSQLPAIRPRPPITQSPIPQSPLPQSPSATPQPLPPSAMEFVPLGPLTEQDLAGPFQLVQVQMPAASLGGLASPLQHPGELVKADVLLSEDGVARGIRIASDESNYPWRLR